MTAVTLPPVHGQFSYQIGGPYTPTTGVQIVDRDHTATPATGLYNICYIDAFQAETADIPWWNTNHPDLLLRDTAGNLIMDGAWSQPLFDISTPAKRTALLTIVGPWIDGCAATGYNAVEPDNLDSYTRSNGQLTPDNDLAFASLLITRAHTNHLAIAQKNAQVLSAQGKQAGFDFVITESCQVYTECGYYTAVYGTHTIEIEYTDNGTNAFTTACNDHGNTTSIELRDRNVTPTTDPNHTEQWCSQ